MFQSPLFALLKMWIPPFSSRIWALLGLCLFVSLASAQSTSLILSSDSLSQGAVWSIISAPFALYPQSFFFIALLLGWLIYQYGGVTSRRTGKVVNWTPFIHLLLWIVGIEVLHLLIPQLNLWSLAFVFLTLTWFAYPLERRWGRKKWTFFCILLIWIPFGIVSLLCLLDLTQSSFRGLQSLERGFLLAWALQQNRRRLALLNIQGRTLAWIILGFSTFEVLISSFSTHSAGFPSALLGLLGTCTSWILIEELWKPTQIKYKVKKGLKILSKN